MKNKLIRQLLMILSGLFVINLFATAVDEFKERKAAGKLVNLAQNPAFEKVPEGAAMISVMLVIKGQTVDTDICWFDNFGVYNLDDIVR
jgi:hypothetical protein